MRLLSGHEAQRVPASARRGARRWRCPRRERRGVDAALYDVPRYGNASFLHFTDTRAAAAGALPGAEREHRRGRSGGDGRCTSWRSSLKQFKHHERDPNGTRIHSPLTSAWPGVHGKLGGFAHLATLVKRSEGFAAQALLLDGGDSWQALGDRAVDARRRHDRRAAASSAST